LIVVVLEAVVLEAANAWFRGMTVVLKRASAKMNLKFILVFALPNNSLLLINIDNKFKNVILILSPNLP